MDPLKLSNVIVNSTGEFHESFTCFTLPPKVNSPGLEEYLVNSKFEPLSYTLPNLEVLMAVVFGITQVLNVAFRRIGLPSLISQILVS